MKAGEQTDSNAVSSPMRDRANVVSNGSAGSEHTIFCHNLVKRIQH
jgi:hypothetical protein